MINAEEGLIQALMDVYVMEKGINQFYRDVASKAHHEETKRTFADLAGWEAEHTRYIQFLYQGLMEDWDLLSFEEFSKTVKPEIVEGGMPLEELEGKIEEFTYLDDMGAIDFALKVEAREYSLYRQLSSQASQSNMKVLFEELAGWEQKHIEYLKKLKNKIGNA
ncbi:MAG: ferritin family protein [Candidatus Sulfobium sp.]|jgi:sulfur-carrier protein adenylyltransferase/sulfurtransferase